MSPKNVVDGYRSAWGAKDFTTARSHLADRLDFVGPIDAFGNADDYIEAIKGLSQIVTGTQTKHEFVDGNDVAVYYDLQTVVASAAPIADWFHVEGDKITQIRVLFDPRPFTPPAV
jgi:hypothetical protein